MAKVGEILGLAAVESEPMIAVVRCNGTCEHRPKTSHYDGARSCQIMHNLYAGETGCMYGCLGCGDCVAVCKFDAIHMNPETGLPEVDEDKCTACGACVKACPKNIIELRKKGPKGRRIFVSCVNKDKGGVARKACAVACIGCSNVRKNVRLMPLPLLIIWPILITTSAACVVNAWSFVQQTPFMKSIFLHASLLPRVKLPK